MSSITIELPKEVEEKAEKVKNLLEAYEEAREHGITIKLEIGEETGEETQDWSSNEIEEIELRNIGGRGKE